MSNRRKLRQPSHVAAFDQAMAYAADLGKDPGTGSVVLDYAAANRQCSWCGCPDGPDSPHQDPEYVCAGCPLPAYYDVHVLVGTPEQALIPVCRGHLAGIKAHIAAMSANGQVDVQLYPPS